MANKYAHFSKVEEAKKDVYRIMARGTIACTRKRQFDTEELAVNYAKLFGYNQKPYKCKKCLTWHLTTIKNGGEQK